MPTLIKNGLVYRNNERCFASLDILIKDGRISSIAESGAFDGVDARIIDASGYRLTSGLIDVHTHGICGYDFLSADSSALKRMSQAYLSHGVTAVMPTLASGRLEDMLDAARRINGIADFCGVHLEGRYLSPSKRGAHAIELLSAPNADELDLFDELKLKNLHVSAAFELDTDKSFLNKALQIGATLSLGHTNASYIEAVELEASGVSAYTHLYNAMPPLHHREGGAISACLLGNAFAELICDGIHVSQEVIKLTYNIKRDKLVLISDSMEATDCPDGEYSIAGNPVTVKGGIARTLDGALAGSTLTLDCALKNLMTICNIPLEDAIINATEAPAKEVGIFNDCGSIDVGKRADILFIDRNAFEINAILKNGESVSQ